MESGLGKRWIESHSPIILYTKTLSKTHPNMDTNTYTKHILSLYVNTKTSVTQTQFIRKHKDKTTNTYTYAHTHKHVYTPFVLTAVLVTKVAQGARRAGDRLKELDREHAVVHRTTEGAKQAWRGVKQVMACGHRSACHAAFRTP